MNVSSKIVSKLGSPDSRIPLAAKDIFNSAGYTYFSYGAGGEIEAKDRLADEVGTGAIWLFGIPVYRKLIDKTVFKKAGISPDVDIRMLQNKDYFDKALEHAPTEKIKQEIEHAGNNLSKTKNLNLLKFALSLGLTMASYFALTKAKQCMTKKNIEKKFLEEQNNKSENDDKFANLNLTNKLSGVFAEFTEKKPGRNPSFGALSPMATVTEFMLNPVKNMIILDTGISGQRIASARTSGERKEYAIKEGSFLFFVYGADKLLKKGINAFSKKFLKTPTDLDAEFLSSNLAEKVLNNKEYQENIKDFANKFASSDKSKEIYDFIFNNPDHIVVKAAKKSGIISVVKDAEGKLKINTAKYINPDKMTDLGKHLMEFIENGADKDKETYLKKIKSFKVASTIFNVAACCFALGYAVPKLMYKNREKNQNGNCDFHVQKEYEKELMQKHGKKA